MPMRYSGPVKIDIQLMPANRYWCAIACPDCAPFVVWVGATPDDIYNARTQDAKTYDAVARAALSFGSDRPSLCEDYTADFAERYASAVEAHAWPAQDGSGWHVTRTSEVTS